ncbi:hypothetical protein BDD12DRAFT_888563 [Trichophaea hybrida]|nr:hypothetical protein BDD12DRAFT_888563 [Trichophaea hybrida]
MARPGRTGAPAVARQTCSGLFHVEDYHTHLYNIATADFFSSATAATLEANVASLERLREVQTADAKYLRRRVDDLEGKNQKFKTTVEMLLVEAKKAKEEKKLATTPQVVTPPTTPKKDVTIRPVPSKTPTQVVTPLAQQVLKRNNVFRGITAHGLVTDHALKHVCG